MFFVSFPCIGSVRDKDELRRRRKALVPASATGLPVLIVAPSTVVPVWMDHLSKWGYFETVQFKHQVEIDVSATSLASQWRWGAWGKRLAMRDQEGGDALGETFGTCLVARKTACFLAQMKRNVVRVRRREYAK